MPLGKMDGLRVCVCVCVIETSADLLTTNVYDHTCFAAKVSALFYRRLLFSQLELPGVLQFIFPLKAFYGCLYGCRAAVMGTGTARM